MNPSVKSLYRRDEIIGQGNFGVVYKGVNLENKQVVAIKVLDLDTAEDEILDIQQEISTLSKLSHSDGVNITKYYGSYLHGTNLWIIMELCIGGSVRTLLKAGRIEEKYMSIIAREVSSALSYIHKEGVIHRDIKAANILITNEGKVRLCDFGVAAQVTSNKIKRSTIVGTPYWMAPEVITEGATYNTKADIWSLGITMYEIATGNPPYSDQEAFRAIMLIPRQKPARLEGTSYSPALKEFVAHCLDEHPDERPSADELGKMKFIKMTRNMPSSSLKEVVSRYMSWRERNKHVRDSVMRMKESQADRRLSDVSSASSDPDTDKWDFDTSSSDDDTTFDYADQVTTDGGESGSSTPSSPPSLYHGDNKVLRPSPSEEAILKMAAAQTNESYPSTQNNTMLPQYNLRSQENTVRGAATALGAAGGGGDLSNHDDVSAPKSLLELFEGGNESNMEQQHPVPPPSAPPVLPAANSNSTEMVSPIIDTFASSSNTNNAATTVEIEIPTFDSMEAESNAATPTTNNTNNFNPISSSGGATELKRTTSYSPSSPQQLSEPITRGMRSNTVGTSAQPTINHHAPPPIPSISQQQEKSLNHPTLQHTQSQPALQHTQMLPPQKTNTSQNSRRTPSPKRMTPKTTNSASNVSKSAGNSPPKPSAVMKPLNRSKTSTTTTEIPEDETVVTTNSPEVDSTTTPNNSMPKPPPQAGFKKPTSLNRGGKLHIAMPPSSLPLNSAPASATATSSARSYSHFATATHNSSSATLADEVNDGTITFPSIPKFDPSSLLDTTSRKDTVNHLDYLLDAFDTGLASIEEGLYNFVR